MIERTVDVNTPDGTMPTFVFHPEQEGPHPVVLYLMDGLSVRPALRDMASRLATAGYYVLLPYLFYRGGPYREFPADDDMTERSPLIDQVNRSNIVDDAEALLALAESDRAASRGKVGVIGFCMTGGRAIGVARGLPDRVGAAASIHGGRLVTDEDDSPHRGLERVAAELYIGWADNDRWAPPETVPIMRKALDDAGVRYQLDFLTDAVHGYAVPGSPRYDRTASEQHWERVHSLFRRNLQTAG